MKMLYDIALSGMQGFVTLRGRRVRNRERMSKLDLFACGRTALVSRIAKELKSAPEGKPRVWIHAASLGEYAVARPVIEELKKKNDCTVIVTFFSPTGYEALKHRHSNIDYLFYIPVDTASNARGFVEAVNPAVAVFIISEFWPNLLFELKKKEVPTFLVSGLIRDDAVFFRPYGSIFRKALRTFTRFFVLDSRSRKNLRKLGFDNVTVSGDPLFDNASLVGSTPWSDSVIETFCNGGKVFIAGSIHDERDLEMVTTLANRHPDVKFIFVPHEIKEDFIRRMDVRTERQLVRYSRCDKSEGVDKAQILVIDFVGALSKIYRYATWAYVGGGFTPLLHSVIEATVYGLPVAFGPKIERKVTPRQLIELGIGQIVNTPDELDAWFRSLKNDEAHLRAIRKVAAEYVAQNVGATDRITTEISRSIPSSSSKGDSD